VPFRAEIVILGDFLSSGSGAGQPNLSRALIVAPSEAWVALSTIGRGFP
jgi:hypothetical protein